MNHHTTLSLCVCGGGGGGVVSGVAGHCALFLSIHQYKMFGQSETSNIVSEWWFNAVSATKAIFTARTV